MNDTRIDELFAEGSGIIGMIAEIKMKLKLIKERPASKWETEDQLGRMSCELDTYRIRLNEICEEIEQHGTFSEMA